MSSSGISGRPAIITSTKQQSRLALELQSSANCGCAWQALWAVSAVLEYSMSPPTLLVCCLLNCYLSSSPLIGCVTGVL